VRLVRCKLAHVFFYLSNMFFDAMKYYQRRQEEILQNYIGYMEFADKDANYKGCILLEIICDDISTFFSRLYDKLGYDIEEDFCG
jgi:hypothetical protein